MTYLICDVLMRMSAAGFGRPDRESTMAGFGRPGRESAMASFGRSDQESWLADFGRFDQYSVNLHASLCDIFTDKYSYSNTKDAWHILSF